MTFSIASLANGDTQFLKDGVPVGEINAAGEWNIANLAGRNIIINGGFHFDQERNGAAVTPTVSGYVTDQWQLNASQASKLTGQRVAGTVEGSPFAYRFTVAVAHSGTSENFSFVEPIEGLNIAELAWGTPKAKPAVLQFIARASIAGKYSGSIRNATTTHSFVFEYDIPVANVDTPITVVIPPAGPTDGVWPTSTSLGALLSFDLGCAGGNVVAPLSTWQASSLIKSTGSVSLVNTLGATWQITNVKLERGRVATPWTPHWFIWDGETQAVRRYCRPLPYQIVGQAFGTTTVAYFTQLDAPMRATPTLTTTAGFQVSGAGGAGIPATGLTVSSMVDSNLRIDATVAGGLAAGQASVLSAPSTTTMLSARL